MIHAEVLALLPLAGIGALAAFLTTLAQGHRLALPRVVRQNGEDGGTVTLIDLGSLGAPILGAVVAVALDGGPRQAFLWGLSAGIMGPAILNSVVEPVLERLGMPRAEVVEKEGTA